MSGQWYFTTSTSLARTFLAIHKISVNILYGAEESILNG